MQKDQPQIVEPFALESEQTPDSFTLKFAAPTPAGERQEVHLTFPRWFADVIRAQLPPRMTDF